MVQVKKIDLPSDEILQNIIPIYDAVYGKMVNARELHLALGIKKKFADWVKMYLKYYSGYHYGTTNIDPENPEEYDYFTFVVPASQGKGRKIEYFLTLDIAKEIAMLSRSAMGKEVRRYFINAEKTLVKVQHVLTSNDKTTEEKLAEALLLSQEIISRTNKDIVRANKNKK